MKKNFISTLLLAALWNANMMAQGMAGGEAHMMLLCTDNTKLRYSGGNNDNQFIPVASFTNYPLNLPQGVTIKSIASGWNHMLLLRSDGKVWSLGDNFYGQLGDGTKTDRNNPVEVVGVSNAVSVGAGSACSYFVLGDGTVKVVGNNGSGQLGINSLNPTNTQNTTNMNSMNNAAKVDGGYTHAILLDKSGNAWAMGQGQYGQLGDSAFTVSVKPRLIESVSDVKDIAANGYHSLFLKNDGTVWAAGYNQYGQLGDGTNTNRKHAVQIPGLTNVIDIAAGESHSLFVKSDGTVWACGINNFGQLGTGDFTDYNYPVQVPGLFNIVAVGAGYNQSFFLQNSGILYGCGFNSSGQVGIGSYNDAPSPQQIQGLQCIVTTSVQDMNDLNNSWNAYPVPTAETLQLSFDLSGTYHIQLTDVLGKVLRQDEVNVQAGEVTDWSVSELQSGTFFISLTNNNRQVSTKRVVKH